MIICRLQVLLDYGADGNSVHNNYGTPLMIASCTGFPNDVTVRTHANGYHCHFNLLALKM